MNFIKKLFGCKEKERVIPPPPIAEPPKPNISAPVYGFVKCVKEHPKRFKIEEWEHKWSEYSTFDCQESTETFTLIDKLTQTSWKVSIDRSNIRFLFNLGAEGRAKSSNLCVEDLGFNLTKDEQAWLISELTPVFEREAAKDRLARINKNRAEREDKANRAKWAEEYPE